MSLAEELRSLGQRMEHRTARRSTATSGIKERSRVQYHVLCSWSLNQGVPLSLSCSLCHTAIKYGTTLGDTSILICLAFSNISSLPLTKVGASIHTIKSTVLSADGQGFVMALIVTQSFRETLESSWTTVWMKTAIAASIVAVVTATADATTNPWEDSTHGHTTIKGDGSSVRS